MGVERLWTRDDVAERVLAGDTLVIYRNNVLRIPPSWLKAHPGGDLAILHFVGRDATDEVDAFHNDEVLKRVRAFSVGQIECTPDGWAPLVPPIHSGWVRRIGLDGKQTWYNEAKAVRSASDTELSPSSQILLVEKQQQQQPPTTAKAGGPSLDELAPPPSALSPAVQARHSAAYKELHERIVAGGFYQCDYLRGYGPELARYILLGATSALLYSRGWFISSAVFLGLLWHQLVFTAHDLGHMGVTGNWVYDRLLGILIADFIGGLSIGWWVDVSAQLMFPSVPLM
jgi:sphingolipid 8-(E)-desaturase